MIAKMQAKTSVTARIMPMDKKSVAAVLAGMIAILVLFTVLYVRFENSAVLLVGAIAMTVLVTAFCAKVESLP